MMPPLDPALLDRLPPEVRAVLEAQAFALSAERAHCQHLESEHAALQAHAARTAAERAAMAAENARMAELLEELAPLIEHLRRARFAPSSEMLDPDQLQLGFEDLELAVAATKEKHGEKDAPGAEAPATGKRRGRPTKEEAPVRRSLPKDLPRTLERIEPDSLIWSPVERHWSERHWRRGCGRMVQIGEDRSERLDIVPVQLRVIETPERRSGQARGAARATPAQRAAPVSSRHRRPPG